MTYPREWLGFRVIIGGQHVRRGGIVEAVHFDYNGDDGLASIRWFFGARILSNATGRASRHPVDGWMGTLIGCGAVEPLTPAARDFLREVRR